MIEFKFNYSDGNHFYAILIFKNKIYSSNGQIMTSWYRKPSNTLMFNSWTLHGPKIYKINFIKTIVNRLNSICSNQILFNRNLEQLKESFL